MPYRTPAYGRAPTILPPQPAPLRASTPALAPGQAPTYDPSRRPEPGGHSPNFLASVAKNNAAAQAKQDTFAANAGPVGSRAVPVMTDLNDTPNTGPADPKASRVVPKFGMAQIGGEKRWYPQTADSQQAKDARVTAGIAGPAAGEDARVAEVERQRQDFYAAHPPTIDPRATVADSVAYKNRAQGDAAAQNADNNRTVADSKAGMNKAHADYFNTLAPARQQELQSQATKAMMQGDLAGAQAILTGEKTTTEQDLREPRRNEIVAQGNNAQAGADQKNALTPHQVDKTDAEADRARRSGTGANNGYGADRQWLDDQVATVRARMAAIPAGTTDAGQKQERAAMQKDLEGLMTQRQNLSAGRVRQSDPASSRPPAPPATQPTQQQPLQAGHGYAPARFSPDQPTAAGAHGAQMTPEFANSIFEEAGRDPARARALAIQRGFKF